MRFIKRNLLYIIFGIIVFAPQVYSFILPLFSINIIDDYRIDVTVEENGDINIDEAFNLTGNYNGYNRIVFYDNKDALGFNPSANEYGGSEIHNGDDIELNYIEAINEEDIYNKDISGNKFEGVHIDSYLTDTSTKLFGVYQEAQGSGNHFFEIYNHHSYDKAFRLNYDITDMAIKYNDIGEFGLNIFGVQQAEKIEKLVINITIPNNKELFEIYAHGNVQIKTDIIDKENAIVTVTDLAPNTPLDIRVLFDKEVIEDTEKVYTVDAYDKIINYEKNATAERNEYLFTKLIYDIISYIMVISYIISLLFLYLKFDKEHKPKKEIKYLRDIPTNRDPWMVSYLMNGYADESDIMLVLSNLVTKDILRLEKSLIGRNNFDFVYINPNDEKLNEIELYVLNWFIPTGLVSGKRITADYMKVLIKKDYEATKYHFNRFKELIKIEADKIPMFDSKMNNYIIAGIIGLVTYLYYINDLTDITSGVTILIILLAAVNILYTYIIKKRSKVISEEYHKWIALKNFLKDFTFIEEKTLVDIKLWEHYIVYSMALSVNDQLDNKLSVIPNEQLNYANILRARIYYRIYSDYRTTMKRSFSVSRATARAKNRTGSGGSFGGGGGGSRF